MQVVVTPPTVIHQLVRQDMTATTPQTTFVQNRYLAVTKMEYIKQANVLQTKLAKPSQLTALLAKK